MADRRPSLPDIAEQGLRALFLCLALLLLWGCQQQARVHTLGGATMGTTWTVKLVAPPEGLDLPGLQRDLEALLESINRQMSTWREESDITVFNRAPAGTWQVLSPDFYHVLDYALRLAADTGGAYDPTVGPLVNLWGFGPDRVATVPDAQQLAAVRERTGWQRTRLDPERKAALQPGGLYLDLSSVAKGYAVDKLGLYLQGRGIRNWLVEIGGELRGAGTKPDGSPWRVAIEKPLVGERTAGWVVELRDLSIATSGDYRNFREYEGRRFSHIIDPRTGAPVTHRLVSVSVLAESCTEADALATALTVLGPEEGMRFAEDRQLAVFFIVESDQGFEERPSRAFTALLEAQEGSP